MGSVVSLRNRINAEQAKPALYQEGRLAVIGVLLRSREATVDSEVLSVEGGALNPTESNSSGSGGRSLSSLLEHTVSQVWVKG